MIDGPRQLVIVGTGGQAREIHAIVEAQTDRGRTPQVVGFLDDDAGKRGATVHGLPVLGDLGWLTSSDVAVAIGVGATRVRSEVVARIEATGSFVFPALVHPAAAVGPRVELGDGTVVGPNAVLTTDIVVGRHVLLNFGCTIGHDAVIDDFATVAPGANVSGAVRIETGADIGTGASIIQGVTVGAWTVVGAGAVVTKDLPANVTAVGVPAAPIADRSDGWRDDAR